MHGGSIYRIRIDFEKSHDSYIYDKNRGRHLLDFFGLYSTLPLGYNHPVFRSKEFLVEYNRIAGVKIPNCEILTDEEDEFEKEFASHPGMKDFQYFHYCCTGALAIEAAIKTAVEQKPTKKPVVLSFKESFHGINSWGCFVTDRFFPVSGRLDGMPEFPGWRKLHTPKILYDSRDSYDVMVRTQLAQFTKEFEQALKESGTENVVALLVEPIQATYGDNYYSQEFFQLIRELCDRHNICLIFDEIQTGFGTSGKMWYYQYTDIIPDVVTFGKKCQTSGLMIRKEWAKIFERPVRLEVTWDGHLSDMIRGKYVLRTYDRENILDNVNARCRQLTEGLREIDGLNNVRGTGHMICFDFDEASVRDEFVNKLLELGMICNKTRERSVRLRPNLKLSEAEADKALDMIQQALKKSAYV